MKSNIEKKIIGGYYSRQDYYLSDMFPDTKKHSAEQKKLFLIELNKRMETKQQEFRVDVFEYYNLPLDHNKADLIFSIATSYGESCDRGNGGLLEIFNCFGELAKLIE
jgi:hypothetical protein